MTVSVSILRQKEYAGESLKHSSNLETMDSSAMETLMRMEGDKEFRIYCEDSGWLIAGSDGPGGDCHAGLR